MLKVRETISADPKLTCPKEGEITLPPSATGLDYEYQGGSITATAKLVPDC